RFWSIGFSRRENPILTLSGSNPNWWFGSRHRAYAKAIRRRSGEPKLSRGVLTEIPPSVPLNPGTSAFRSLGPVFFYFFIAGIATVMLGPLLPALIARWHIQDAQAGTLFTTTFAGQLCGSWFATRNLR